MTRIVARCTPRGPPDYDEDHTGDRVEAASPDLIPGIEESR